MGQPHPHREAKTQGPLPDHRGSYTWETGTGPRDGVGWEVGVSIMRPFEGNLPGEGRSGGKGTVIDTGMAGVRL